MRKFFWHRFSKLDADLSNNKKKYKIDFLCSFSIPVAYTCFLALVLRHTSPLQGMILYLILRLCLTHFTFKVLSFSSALEGFCDPFTLITSCVCAPCGCACTDVWVVGTRDRIFLYWCSRVFRCVWVACVQKCDLWCFGGNFGITVFCFVLMLMMFIAVFWCDNGVSAAGDCVRVTFWINRRNVIWVSEWYFWLCWTMPVFLVM